MPASHGTSLTHRNIGSTGQRDAPGKVWLWVSDWMLSCVVQSCSCSWRVRCQLLSVCITIYIIYW